MKQRLSVLLAIAATIAALTGCSGSRNLKFFTGSDQSTYYSFGSVLAGQISSATDTQVTAFPAESAQANIQALSSGDVQFALVPSDVMNCAYDGSNLFSAPVKNFSVIAALYPEQVQIVTLDPTIRTVTDLAGKTVSVGDAGSGAYFNAADILSMYGLDVERDITPVHESSSASAESLQENELDAAFIVAGAPEGAISSLAATRDVYLISLDDSHINQLRAAVPYYSKDVIPADTYETSGDVTTVAVDAVIIARDDVSEDDAYHFISGIFENLDAIASSHARGAELDPAYAASVTSVPYHPGAAKYYGEQGLAVNSK